MNKKDAQQLLYRLPHKKKHSFGSICTIRLLESKYFVSNFNDLRNTFLRLVCKKWFAKYFFRQKLFISNKFIFIYIFFSVEIVKIFHEILKENNIFCRDNE